MNQEPDFSGIIKHVAIHLRDYSLEWVGGQNEIQFKEGSHLVLHVGLFSAGITAAVVGYFTYFPLTLFLIRLHSGQGHPYYWLLWFVVSILFSVVLAYILIRLARRACWRYEITFGAERIAIRRRHILSAISETVEIPATKIESTYLTDHQQLHTIQVWVALAYPKTRPFSICRLDENDFQRGFDLAWTNGPSYCERAERKELIRANLPRS